VVVHLLEVYCFLQKNDLKQRKNREKATPLNKEKIKPSVCMHEKLEKWNMRGKKKYSHMPC